MSGCRSPCKYLIQQSLYPVESRERLLVLFYSVLGWIPNGAGTMVWFFLFRYK